MQQSSMTTSLLKNFIENLRPKMHYRTATIISSKPYDLIRRYVYLTRQNFVLSRKGELILSKIFSVFKKFIGNRINCKTEKRKQRGERKPDEITCFDSSQQNSFK